jgi:hypothetical protein
MKMTDKEKLAKALKVLSRMGTVYKVQEAMEAYAELTAPVMETVEVVRWVSLLTGDCRQEHMMINVSNPESYVKLVGTYQREIKEPEVVEFEGEIQPGYDRCPFVPLPPVSSGDYIGKRVTVRVEEP